MMSTTRSRRLKWHPTPPSPKIINLPTRRSLITRRKKPKPTMGSLFGEERERREEKWRFQAEILRAECNFLRMERKFALKNLETHRRILKSALQNLASGGNNMEEVAQKLEELQRSFNNGVGKCMNFDKKTSRSEKLGGLSDANEIKQPIMNEDSSSFHAKTQTKSTHVEILTRKMEGRLDRMEAEYESILSTSANTFIATSKGINLTHQDKEPSMMSNEGNNKCSGRCKVLVRRIVEQVRAETEQWSQMQEMLGQLRQEMEELQASREFWETQALASANEIESLQSSVQEWREKAISFETTANELQAEAYLVKSELEKLKKDQIKEVPSTPKKMTVFSLSKQLEKEKHVLTCRVNGKCDSNGTDKGNNRQEKIKQGKELMSLGKQLAREKRILLCRLKENGQSNNKVSSEGGRKGHNRLPFKDAGNYSSLSSSSAAALVRQNSNAIFPLNCPVAAKMV